jgi:hypothetical protein
VTPTATPAHGHHRRTHRDHPARPALAVRAALMLSRNNLFWFVIIWVNSLWVIPLLKVILLILTWPFRALG